ncbi:MAG: hypothetical protein IPG81_19710 [Sandaracinaceae bacterium]|nr:hypothetical protein [Sandaracinaceae bacterium]
MLQLAVPFAWQNASSKKPHELASDPVQALGTLVGVADVAHWLFVHRASKREP